jgi:hypothetical protein
MSGGGRMVTRRKGSRVQIPPSRLAASLQVVSGGSRGAKVVTIREWRGPPGAQSR